MTAVPDDLQRLLAEEPFVRRLARQLVHDDADDVVQQAWLRVLAARPRLLREPRHWLASVVRRLGADHRRAERHRSERERAAAAGREPFVPSSSELLDGEERRRELIAAVDALPAPLRTVVLLRWYDGEPPRRIAARLGLPVTTVSNRLHTALHELRRKLDARHGERRAWLLPLVPFADLPRALPWRELSLPHAALAAGAIVTTKTKLGLLAAALVAAAAWISWPALRGAAASAPDTGATARAETAAAANEPAAAHEPAAAAPPPRELAPPTQATSVGDATGAVVVHVRYADEPRAVAGVVVRLGRRGQVGRYAWPSATTDAAGDARFDAVPAGPVVAAAAVNPYLMVAGTVDARATTELTVDLKVGLTVTGVVVDPAGTPVGGAMLEVSMPIGGLEPGLPGVTAADGTFTLRGCEPLLLIGARAAGFAASQMHFFNSKPGATEHVRIELRPDGGTVTGHVLDSDGRPVRDAVVQVGAGNRQGILATRQGAPPLPAGAFTDAVGRFHAIGVPQGAQRVQAAARGFAPWSGTCDVLAGAATAVRIVLQPGVTCRGLVRSEDGAPSPAARVECGEWGDFAWRATDSAADGTFVLDGLAVGECTLRATHGDHGKGSVTLRAGSGEDVACELVLAKGIVLNGRVVDDADAPVRNVMIDIEGAAKGGPVTYGSLATSDEAGRFRVANVPAGHRLTLRATSRDFAPLVQHDVDAAGGEVELRLQRATGKRAQITGRLVLPNGSAAAGESVTATRLDARMPPEYGRTAADGTFALDVWPGTWVLRASTSKHPELRVGPEALLAGGSWDVGALQLTRGGTLVVRGEPPAGARLFVYRPDGTFVAGVASPLPPLRSELLNPGEYRLLVRAEGIAAMALPFAIRDGEEAELEVRTVGGVRQRFEVRAAADTELPRFVSFRIERGGELVAMAETGPAGGSGVLTATAWLAPGSYTLTTVHGAAAQTMPFDVGTAEGDVVRVTLR
jgi:RNA polymerase sigma factor (sigma-70 family)